MNHTGRSYKEGGCRPTWCQRSRLRPTASGFIQVGLVMSSTDKKTATESCAFERTKGDDQYADPARDDLLFLCGLLVDAAAGPKIPR